MSQVKTHVKKGDTVKVITGNSKGKEGIVLDVNVTKKTVIVGGVRTVTKAKPKSEQNPDGGLFPQDAPIHISNVKKLG